MRIPSLLGFLLAIGLSASFAGEPAPLPEGDQGLAAKYPGDAGIEKDPQVVCVEMFDGMLDQIAKRWENVKEREGLSVVADAPAGSASKTALLVTHTGGQGTGGALYRRLQPGFAQLFARFYVKFDPECAEIHHFGTCIGGNNPSTAWPQVKSGFPTEGDKGFWVGIEPFGKSWVWDYYTYWVEMRGSPPKGQTWGNSFIRDPKLKVEKGKWICIEQMVKLNDVGESNGELALWIDGKRVSHLGKGFPQGTWTFDKFNPGMTAKGVRWNREQGNREEIPGGVPFEGFRWRTAKELTLNFVWPYVYITGAPQGHVSRVWFDQIVVATQYIGPLLAPSAPPSTPQK